MVNTNMFRHPKYYKELRKRNKSDQVISSKKRDGECERASWSGPQASRTKTNFKCEQRFNPQATSFRQQATSTKQQAQFRMILKIILKDII